MFHLIGTAYTAFGQLHGQHMNMILHYFPHIQYIHKHLAILAVFVTHHTFMISMLHLYANFNPLDAFLESRQIIFKYTLIGFGGYFR